ncbi:MAG: PAS domain-containing protein, partial [Desulfuromonadaceae bacterium]|nr:PAS domain-containing protein [Desulfuromonadaceae bacterium]
MKLYGGQRTMFAKALDPAVSYGTADKEPVEAAPEVRSEAILLQAGALQNAIFNSANFSSIATDAKGVIQIFNVGAERMLGYTAAEVMNRITPADISDPQEVISRAKALSVELGTPITPGFEALVFKASRGI